jgi:hypothetical protein
MPNNTFPRLPHLNISYGSFESAAEIHLARPSPATALPSSLS